MTKSTAGQPRLGIRAYIHSMSGIRIPWFFLVLMLALSIFSTFAAMNISLFTGSAVDAQGDIPTNELVQFAVSYLLIGISAGLEFLFSCFAQEKINLGLRSKLWRKIMYTSQKSYDCESGEALVSRVTTDCDYASRLLIALVDIVSTLVSIGICVNKMYSLNAQMSNMMLILIPISMLIGIGYSALNYRVARKTQAMLACTTTYLVERTRSLHLIKTSNTQEQERELGLKHFDEQYKMQFKAGLLNTLYIALERVYGILAVLIPFLVGAALVNDKIIKKGIVIAFYSIAGSAGTNATSMISHFGNLRKANGALARVISVLRMPDDTRREGAAVDGPSQDITLEEVSFSYTDHAVLRNISCTIPKNKVTAVVGSNGSGKSTLFKLLDRLYDPESGAMYLGAVNASEYDLSAWRKAFCLVAQGSPIMQGTIRENICYGCRRSVSQEELEQVTLQTNLLDVIRAMPSGFDTMLSPGGSNLSGGQRQLIAIARAMMNDPEYLLLDEATSNLDAHSEACVLQALDRLMQGRTTVIIAHSLAAIRKADHVIILHEGRLEGEGTPSEILNITGNYLSTVMNRHAGRN